MHIISWSPCQNPAVKFNTKNTCALHVHTLNFSASSQSARVNLNFISHFAVMATTSVCSVIWQFCSNKLGRKYCFDSVCLLNYQYNVMEIYSHYPDHTQQLVFQLFWRFQWTVWNIAKYLNVSYHSELWYNRIVKSLPIPSPGNWPTYCHLTPGRGFSGHS